MVTYISGPSLPSFSLLFFLLPAFALCPASAPSLAQQLVTMTTRAFCHKVAFQVFYFEPQLSRTSYRLGAVQGSMFYGL